MFFTMTLPPFWLAAFLRVRKSLNPEDEMYSKAVQSRIMVFGGIKSAYEFGGHDAFLSFGVDLHVLFLLFLFHFK